MPFLNGMYYRTEGSGPVVVLVHGFAEDGTIWSATVDGLKDKFRLLVPDLPGSGQSVIGPDVEFSMDYFAKCISDILEAESVGSCAMIGHSMGGYITLAFAEQYADRLQSLGLFHSTAYADSEEKKEARGKSIIFIQQHGAAAFIQQAVPALFSEKTKTTRPSIVSEIVKRYTNFSADALVNYYRAMINRPDRTAILKTFPRPVMLIIGEHDTAVPPEQTLKQSYLPEISHVLILNNSGHMGMIEEPERSVAFVKRFLTESEMANL